VTTLGIKLVDNLVASEHIQNSLADLVVKVLLMDTVRDEVIRLVNWVIRTQAVPLCFSVQEVLVTRVFL